MFGDASLDKHITKLFIVTVDHASKHEASICDHTHANDNVHAKTWEVAIQSDNPRKFQCGNLIHHFHEHAKYMTITRSLSHTFKMELK